MATSLLARIHGTNVDTQPSSMTEEVDEFLRSIVLDMGNESEEPSLPDKTESSATSTMNDIPETPELVEEGEIFDPPAVLALYPSNLVSIVQENLTRREGQSSIPPDALHQKITELFTDDVCRSLAGLNKQFNTQFEIKLNEVHNALSSRVKSSDPVENEQLAHSPDRPTLHKIGSDMSFSDSGSGAPDADSSAKQASQNESLPENKDDDKDNTSREATLPDWPRRARPRGNSMNSSPIVPERDVLYVPTSRRYSASSTYNPRSPPAPLSRKEERILSAHQMSQILPHDNPSGYGIKRKRDREGYLPYDDPASSSSSSRSDSPARYVHRLPKRREDLMSYIPGRRLSTYETHNSDNSSMSNALRRGRPVKRRRATEGQADFERRKPERIDGLTQSPAAISPPTSATTPPLTASSTAIESSEDVPCLHSNGLETNILSPSSDNPYQNLSYPVPSLWDVRDGLPSPGILSIDFFLDTETSTQLCIPKADSDKPVPASQLPFRLQLLCTLDEAWNDLTFDPSSVTASQMAEEVLKMEFQWPRKGDLIVQVNEGTPWRRTYMPNDLGPSSPPLDLTAFVREGRNTIRLIQLSDMSRHIFVLHASSRTLESPNPSAEIHKLLMLPSPFATSLATH